MFLKNNKGFSLIFAIFLLIVFAIIGVSLVTMLTTSSQSSAEDLLSTQSFYLAESGVEIRIMQLINGDSSANKNYYFQENNDFKIYTNLKTIAILPNGKTLYSIKSKGQIGDIKRTIKVKFWN